MELPYGTPINFGGLQLTTFPAGHCLGSAMLLADDGAQRLLYTGDFKLRDSATAEPAEVPRADILIMESTFGRPRFRLPPREQAIAQLVELVQGLIREDRTPVLHLYPLGKSQEVTRILTDHGIRVLQHPEILAISRVYEQCGISLGRVAAYRPGRSRRSAVITLPKACPRFRLPGLVKPVSLAVTGWALGTNSDKRLSVDYAVPLSDHADYDELLETVRRVAPSRVYCTHGPAEFVDHLRAAGWNAEGIEWSTVRGPA